MSIVNASGVKVSQIVIAMKTRITEQECERLKSQAMLVMIQRGATVGYVAKHYKVHRTTVWRRIRAIPKAARRSQSALG